MEKRKDSNIKILWGLTAKKELLHINDALSGKDCACICPSCETPLIAKKRRSSDRFTEHFAHENIVNCNGESVLHYVGKYILEEAAKNNEPIRYDNIKGSEAKQLFGIAKPPFTMKWSAFDAGSEVQDPIKNAVIERGDGNQIYDALCTTNNFEALAIEIFVTNSKSDEDIVKFKEKQLSCLQINLSGLEWDATYEEIKDAVLQSAPREWLYCNEATQAQENAKSLLQNSVAVKEEYYSKRLFNMFASALTDYFDSGSVVWEALAKRITVSHLGYSKTQEGEFEPSFKEILSGPLQVQSGWTFDARLATGESLHVHLSNNTGTSIPDNADVSVHLESITLSHHKTIEDKFAFVADVGPTGRLEKIAYDYLEKKLSPELIKDIEREVNRQNAKKRKQAEWKAFAEWFMQASDNERLSFLCKKLNLTPPETFTYPFDSPFKSSRPVWKLFIYWALMQRGNLTHLDTQKLADHKRLHDVLPIDKSLRISRSKMIYRWLYKLLSMGVLEHCCGIQFFHSQAKLRNIKFTWEMLEDELITYNIH